MSFELMDVLGVRFGVLDMDTALDHIAKWVDAREQGYICVQGAHGIMEAQKDPALLEVFNNAAMVTPDGVPVVWCGKLLGRTHMTRVYGPDLFEAACELGAERGWRFFYYGGDDGLAAELAELIERENPGVQTAGYYEPPFRPLTDNERADVVRRINESDADIVWVGLSTPKQDRWMAEMRDDLDPPLLIGVGAAFNFRTGRARQAPRWIQRSGLEWLFRLAMEPRRLWRRYLVTIPPFAFKLLRRRPRIVEPAELHGAIEI